MTWDIQSVARVVLGSLMMAVAIAWAAHTVKSRRESK